MKLSQYRCWGWRRASLGHGTLVVHEGVQQCVGRSAMVGLSQGTSFRQLESGVRGNVLGRFCEGQRHVSKSSIRYNFLKLPGILSPACSATL